MNPINLSNEMGKSKGWITYVRKLFNGPADNSRPKTERKLNKWTRFLGKSSSKFRKHRRASFLKAPDERRTLVQATEEQWEHAVSVAIATAAAAEAAVSAANTAAEVVRLTHFPFGVEWKDIRHFSAIKIQTFYRGHLARKALNALKGLVRLQALIRGELVRNRVERTLNSMSLSVDMHPLLHRPRASPQARRIDQTLQTSHEHTVIIRGHGKFLPYDEFTVHQRHEETGNLNRLSRTNTISVEQLRLRSMSKRQVQEDLNSSLSRPRRSFSHLKQKSIEESGFTPISPILPQYMATTESAKAKTRSSSTPRIRSWSLLDGETTNLRI